MRKQCRAEVKFVQETLASSAESPGRRRAEGWPVGVAVGGDSALWESSCVRAMVGGSQGAQRGMEALRRATIPGGSVSETCSCLVRLLKRSRGRQPHPPCQPPRASHRRIDPLSSIFTGDSQGRLAGVCFTFPAPLFLSW